MTKVSHGPDHYRGVRANQSEFGLIVKHVRILPEDKAKVEALVAPYKERADLHFQRASAQRKAELKRQEIERQRQAEAKRKEEARREQERLAKAPPTPVPHPAEPPQDSCATGIAPGEAPWMETRKRPTLRLSAFRQAS
jgi:hypothetical protein